MTRGPAIRGQLRALRRRLERDDLLVHSAACGHLWREAIRPTRFGSNRQLASKRWAGGKAAFITTAATASCSLWGAGTTTEADWGGVAIIADPSLPALLDWTLDTTRIFGGDDSGPATFCMGPTRLGGCGPPRPDLRRGAPRASDAERMGVVSVVK